MVGQAIVPVYDCLTGPFESVPHCLHATLRGMYFTVKWTARVDGPGPQPGVPQWDEDSLVIGGTHYVQAEWSTITIYSDATPTEPPPREKTGDDPGE